MSESFRKIRIRSRWSTLKYYSAVLVIKNGSTKLINISRVGILYQILDLIPDIVDKFTNRRKEDVGCQLSILFPEERREEAAEDK